MKAQRSGRRQKLEQEFPDNIFRVIPAYIYDKIEEPDMVNFAKRKNLLFVGGFNHLPNADAAAFADRIVRLYKDDSALKAMVMNSGKLIENYYTVEQALKIISPDFGGRLK